MYDQNLRHCVNAYWSDWNIEVLGIRQHTIEGGCDNDWALH
jgi:hypothetical protein